MSPQLPLPRISLPVHITPHLRALIYASQPGSTVTNLTLSEPPLQTISLTQVPPAIPLYHPPLPKTPPQNLFLARFPLQAHLTKHSITFATTLPYATHDLSDEVPLTEDSLSNTPTTILLRTGTSTHTHGLLTYHSGRYEPLLKHSNREIIGAWGNGHSVFLHAGLLYLARYLYRRCNRRIATTRTVRKNIVLIRFSEGSIMVSRGWLQVDGVRKYACSVPLRGGVAEFRLVGDQGHHETPDQNIRQVRGGDRGDRQVEVVRSDRQGKVARGDVKGVVEAEKEEEEEFMSAKMREFNFGDDADNGVTVETNDNVVQQGANEGDTVNEATEGDTVNIDEQTTGVAHLTISDVEVDTAETENGTTTSSDGDREEEMLEALCKQYLNRGWEESVKRELTSQDTQQHLQHWQL